MEVYLCVYYIRMYGERAITVRWPRYKNLSLYALPISYIISISEYNIVGTSNGIYLQCTYLTFHSYNL